ncbi:MAG: class I SAM-dependent methyltransferase [Solirubrobacterales bacterium]|nr:class I SAM-dependent methyltransferase [Solirubrobacterales bacterium]
MSIAEQRDWYAWHHEYGDPESELSNRLAVVQAEIRRVLPEHPAEAFQVVSICAGQGHDIIGVLADYPHADRVKVRLVELNPDNVAQIRARAEAANRELEVIEGDAADTALYAGAVPADLVLAVGIFGNVSDADVLRTIDGLAAFTKPGGSVIWSRGRGIVPDITPQIRSRFAAAGFVETAFHAPDGARFQIGANRYEGQAVRLSQGHLFSFRR